MTGRVFGTARRLRRRLSRSEWTATLLRLPRSGDAPERPGLLLVQVDGLSRERLTRAVASGAMPFVGHLLDDEGYRLHPLYSGLPSSTPAAQAELFYGVPLAVPAFGFATHEDGRLVRMWQPEAVTTVERRLAEGHRSLLAGGSSYCNVYGGEAVRSRFCMATLGLTDALRTSHPLAVPALVALYAPELVRAAVLVARELLAAPGGVLAGVARGQDVVSELKFAPARAVMGVLLRELAALCVMVDVARGLPVVHVNLLGYDEYAHRRGPSSPLALHALAGIDAVVRRLVRAAGRSSRRSYEVWILSDHGQEETEPYVETQGRPVAEAVADVFRAHGLELPDGAGEEVGRRGGSATTLARRLAGLLAPGLDFAAERRHPGRVAVAAQGPVGHVYAPRPLAEGERDAVAAALVADAAVPLVLAADGPGSALAWTRTGRHRLPDEAAAVLGADHPYLAAVADDLVRLCRHDDAGDFVISGWRPEGRPVSFPHENGSHAGPGPQETDAFVLLPGDTPLAPAAGGPLRAADVRAAALDVLDRGVVPLRRRRTEPPAGTAAATARLMTYNVHGCLGMDGRLSTERIARLIARHDPDVVALQELDVNRARSLGVDQAAAIAAQLEMLLEFHPVLRVAEEAYGDAVLSRLPMRLVRAGPLPALARSRPLEPRGALWVEIGTGPEALQVVNTHLSLHPAERGLQVRALLGPGWLGGVAPGSPAVLCGDFNALGWFPSARRITRRFRDVQVGGIGHRPRNTWSGRLPLGRIDHVFVDPTLEVLRVDVPDDRLARVASDHLPLVVDLRRRPPAGS